MIEPASSSRVFARWAISCAKSKTMSVPASGRPKGLPFNATSSSRWTLAALQAAPSSSGVTATGEKAEAGLDWRKPKPLASSPGIRLRRLTSLTSISRRTAFSHCAGVAPIGRSPVTTATSASKSMPQSSLAAKIGSQGPAKLSEPPWYISGSVQNSGGNSAPRALRTSST